jgi:hypothetical protein
MAAGANFGSCGPVAPGVLGCNPLLELGDPGIPGRNLLLEFGDPVLLGVYMVG